MLDNGESQKEVIRPDFNRAIMIGFQGAQISSDTGFILLREIDERFSIFDPMRDCLEDLRSPAQLILHYPPPDLFLYPLSVNPPPSPQVN